MGASLQSRIPKKARRLVELSIGPVPLEGSDGRTLHVSLDDACAQLFAMTVMAIAADEKEDTHFSTVNVERLRSQICTLAAAIQRNASSEASPFERWVVAQQQQQDNPWFAKSAAYLDEIHRA